MPARIQRIQRILGIDPGSQITGFGVVEAHGNRLVHVDNGIIRPTKKAYADRLAYIFDALTAQIAACAPVAVAIEAVFVGKNMRSALHLGQARGVALLCAAKAGLPVHEYATRDVKQAVVGYGNATKQQIQFMTAKLLGLPEPATEDAADALAVAITHARYAQKPAF